MSRDLSIQLARAAVRRSPLLMAGTAAGVALVLLVALAILGISSDGQQGAASSKPNTSCVAGSGLRPGVVPNGWDVDVNAAAQVSGVPAPILAAQLETESSWNPDSVGDPTDYGTAKGLAQFIDSTWAAYGEGSPFDPEAAIAAMGKYMAALMVAVEQLSMATGVDRVVLALASYNAGPAAVASANGVPAIKQTQDYVVKIPELAQTKYAGDCQPQAVSGEVVVVVAPGEWASPLPGGTLTSPFGQRGTAFHAGLDLSVAGGIVTAPVELAITHAGDLGDGYGTSVVGRTVDGTDIQMRFAHCAAASNTVNTGDVAAAGTKLCTMGNTGNSTGPHLHFEIYQAGVSTNAYHSSCGCAVDPRPILASKGFQF